MVKRIAGAFVFLLGVVLLCWLGYNFLVERQPESRAVNPLPAILFTIGFLYVGQKWMRNR